jgi:magnesium-transporting ATPase (P-type)
MTIGGIKYGQNQSKNGLIVAIKDKDMGDQFGSISNVNFEDHQFKQHMGDHTNMNYNNIQLFLQCLVLCNSAMLEHESKQHGRLVYQTSSPDELALVNAARSFGYIFKGRDINNKIFIHLGNEVIEYELLNMIEYSSERKKMSVIVKCPDGKIRLFAKGADSAIRPLISINKNLLNTTDEHLLEFAREGLRTLMIAYKEISPADHQRWNDSYMVVIYIYPLASCEQYH